jgi:L-aminopeptidase/D-esterase-like protein
VITVAFQINAAMAAESNLRAYSADELKATCEKAGTSFSQGSSGYGCGTDCKGGKGTDCTVFCPTNPKRCTAQVMGSRRPKTAEEALAPSGGRKK